MKFDAISHRSAFTDCYCRNRDEAILNIRTGKDITAVNLICEDPYAYGISGDFRWLGKPIPMRIHRELKDHLVWSVTVRPEYKRLQYYFEIFCAEEKWLLLEDDFYTEESLYTPGRWKQYFKLPWMNPSDVISPPEWVEETVWYQIMPDRFCNSGVTGKRMPLKDWNDRETVGYQDFYGGDLPGIIRKLPYLRELGITGIYLLPIFLSDSNHKYNTFDYEKVDPDFGTEEDVRELVQKAHSLGIRVMLDAVFNHSGTEFFAWKDVWEKGEDSTYFDWFCINQKPFRQIHASLRDGRFYGFAFLDTMPKLNTDHPQVVRYFLDRCRYWVENWNIDGIRFDVGNEVSHSFLKRLYGPLKALKPDLFLLGEIWHDSVQWLQGDEYDSVMNYPFMGSIHNFWVDRDSDSRDFMYAVNRVYSRYPEQVNRVLFNFLDTHDTLRAWNRCGDPDVFYQQLTVLMTMPGTSCIYYGTEIAMPGGHDPDCRRTMPWDEIDSGIHNQTMQQLKMLIHLRRTCSQIRGTEIRWHHDPEYSRLICYDRPGTNIHLRVWLNCTPYSISIPDTGSVLYSRKYENYQLAPGGVLVKEVTE